MTLLPAMRTAARRGLVAATKRGGTAFPSRVVASSSSSSTAAAVRSLSAAASAPAPAAVATGGQRITAMTADNPHVDVVHYEHKNRTWSVNHVEYYSTALAVGFMENGFQPGDVVLSWLPEHFSETMVLQFACSKAGLILYQLDPAVATEDPIGAGIQLDRALKVTKANVLISQEAGSDVNYVRLAEQVIPELSMFDTGEGMPFVTPRYPDLRLCIHTGFDQEDKYGWYLLKHMIVPSDNLDTFVDTDSITGSTPLAGELVFDVAEVPVDLDKETGKIRTEKKRVPVGVGKPRTNAEVIQSNLWPTYGKILQKQFHRVDGVGVVF